jgi:hypothetical protein
MTDIEKEIMRQIHEMDKEIKTLRERVAVLESKHHHGNGVPQHPMYLEPPFKVTCGVKK